MRDQDRDAGRRRCLPSRARRRVALEQRVLGLGVERRRRLVEHEQQRLVAHEAARQRELLPLAERDLDAAGPRRAELGLEAGGQSRHDVVGPGRPDGGDDGRLVVDARHVADARRCGGRGTRTGRSPGTRRRAAAPVVRAACGQSGAPSTRMRPDVGSYSLHEQLHERRLAGAVLADDGDDRAGRQREVDVVEHEALGAGIGERHVLEADAVGEARRRRLRPPSRRATPRSPRARPAAASRPSRCRAGSRSRRRSRRCRPTAASRRPARAARRPGGAWSPDATKTTAPT